MAIQIAAECRTQQRFQLYTGASSTSSSTTKANNAPCPYEDGVMSRGEQEALLDRLPEDLLHRIYSLVPLQDAARAACVSRKFLHSWRRYPNLALNWTTLGLTDTKLGLNEETSTVHGQSYIYKLEKRESYLVNTIDHILKKHSGIGVEKFKLACASIDAHYLDSWLQMAAKSRIKDLALELSSSMKTEYNFPCGLLCSETIGSSLQSLRLHTCAFRPETFGYLTRLTCLVLHCVLINEEQLRCLLSNSCALVKLEMLSCNEIVCLQIPCSLSKLSFLRVLACKMLQSIEINAPKLSGFHYGGSPTVQMSFGDKFALRDMHLWGYLHLDMILYARTKLPSIAPNVESLTLMSHTETVNTPMEPGKFLHLKSLDITLSGRQIFSPSYDFFSLISFMDASPVLESFALRLKQDGLRHDSIVGEFSGGPEDIRQKPECRHDCLKKVTITGFCSTKSLVELTSYIVENTSSLESLTLDTTQDNERNFPKRDRCFTMSKDALLEAHKSLEAIRRFIVGKVPSNICLEVIEPCKRCQSHIIQDA